MKRILLLTTILLTGVIFSQDNFNIVIILQRLLKMISGLITSSYMGKHFGGGFPSGVVILLKQYRKQVIVDHYHSNTGQCPWKYTTVGSQVIGIQIKVNLCNLAINSTTSSNGFHLILILQINGIQDNLLEIHIIT